MLDRPAALLLIAEARRALEHGAAPGFPQKVAANALGIAERELALGPEFERAVRERIGALLGEFGSAGEATEALCAAIRSGTLRLDDPMLIDHLIRTSVAKLAVDQPTYPAYRAWRGEGDGGQPRD